MSNVTEDTKVSDNQQETSFEKLVIDWKPVLVPIAGWTFLAVVLYVSLCLYVKSH